MRNKLIISIVVLILLCCCKDGWLDVNSDWWKAPELPVSYKYRSINFDIEESDLIEHFKYKGEFSTANLTIAKDDGMDWLTITKENAILTNGVDESFHILLNTEFLKEGPNAGKIIYKIKEEEGKQWVVPVSANGNIDISFDKKQIDFGKVNVQSTLTLKSITGKRVINFTEYPDWIKLSKDVVALNQYNDDENNAETIIVTCDRNKLQYGNTTGELVVKSEGGLLNKTINLSVDMIEYNDSVRNVGEYGFKIEKIYKNEDNVILTLRIYNGRFLKTFYLDTSASYAESGGIKYKMDEAKIKIEKKQSGNMNITIKSVPEEVKSFSVISISIKEFSESIVFENVEL